MPEIPTEAAIREMVFQRFDFGARGVVSRTLAQHAEVDIWERSADHIVISLRTFLYGRLIEEWPRTWWQHFKQRWFPGWAKRRWPVRMVNIWEVYPELTAPDSLMKDALRIPIYEGVKFA